MPAGRLTSCEDCYWLINARQRIAIDLKSFASAPMATEFDLFGEWLVTTYGGKKAALSVHRYLVFFLDIESQWGAVPSYNALVSHFKPEGLRRVQRPMKWLAQTHGIFPDPIARQTASEEDQIERILAAFAPVPVAGDILCGYAGKLRQRLYEGKTSIRSIRLALTPAAKLLRLSVEVGHNTPNQRLLEEYLQEHPGQRAAITGFINYLNLEFETKLTPCLDADKVRRRRKQKLERQLANLMEHRKRDSAFLDQWTPVALEYFHGLKVPKRLLWTLLASIQYVDNFGATVVFNGQTYFFPVPERTSERLGFYSGHTSDTL